MNRVHVQTVLVVDDDPEWLDFLSRAIGSQYPVLSATNGEDAVRRARRACPDVIILDVMLYGGKDGFSTYAELQNDPRTQDIPVIIFTEVNRKTGSDFGAENINQYLGKAPAAFLEKPISAERLLEEVRKVLQMIQPEESVAKVSKERPRPFGLAHSGRSVALQIMGIFKNGGIQPSQLRALLRWSRPRARLGEARLAESRQKRTYGGARVAVSE